MAQTRRALAGGAAPALLGTAAAAGGPTIMVAPSVGAAAPSHPDADLLALRPRFNAALREMSAAEMFEPTPGISVASIAHGERLTEVCEELVNVCWAIVESPPAQTTEGRALKAAAAMHELRVAYDGSGGSWPGDGEALAWGVLSEIAGDAYVPVTRPVHLSHTEPERA